MSLNFIKNHLLMGFCFKLFLLFSQKASNKSPGESTAWELSWKSQLWERERHPSTQMWFCPYNLFSRCNYLMRHLNGETEISQLLEHWCCQFIFLKVADSGKFLCLHWLPWYHDYVWFVHAAPFGRGTVTPPISIFFFSYFLNTTDYLNCSEVCVWAWLVSE